MPTFFNGGAVGRAIACKDEHSQGTTSFISAKGDKEIKWTTHKSIITRISLGYQGNYQFLHTIGNDVYIYVFGDRMGQITISGISMTADCDRLGDPKHGFELIMEWYQQNRVASRKAPVNVTIGRTAIEGFVVGLNGDVVDPGTRLVQYALQMVTLPDKAAGGQAGDSGSSNQSPNSGCPQSTNPDGKCYESRGLAPSSQASGPTRPIGNPPPPRIDPNYDTGLNGDTFDIPGYD